MRGMLCGILLCGLGTTAATQEPPVNFEETQSVTISGFAVGTWSYDRNLRQNTAAGSKLALSVFRPWGDQLYLFAQLTTHLSGPHGPGGTPDTHVEIDNLIVSWTVPGASTVNLWFGRFDAPLGFERDDEPLNVIPTTSLNFELARPAKLTGLLARYQASPVIGVSAFVANGWNEEFDNNTGKTAGLRLQLLPGDGAAIGLNALYGPQEDDFNAHQRALLSADATLQPVAPLILGLELNHGWQREAGANLKWTGGVGTAFWRFGRNLGLSIRGEVLKDEGGILTGAPQTLKSLTISPWYFYREAKEGVFANVEHTTFHLPAFSLRPAIRFDRSTEPFFEDHDGLLVRANVSAVLELVYLF